MTSLNGSSASFTVRVAHEDSGSTLKAGNAASWSWTKANSASGVGGAETHGCLKLLPGEKAEIFITSSNASDTNVSGTVDVMDLDYGGSQIGIAGAGLTGITGATLGQHKHFR